MLPHVRQIALPSAFALLAALLLPGAAAGVEPIVGKPGPVVLPLTGLSFDLPTDKRAGFTWNLTGSYSYTDGGASFDARDVIDEKVNDKLVAGNWVHIGYFNAGNCKATVADADFTDTWTDERDLYGIHWDILGGTWDFANDLGKVPAIAMCAHREGRGDLLLYRFFIAPLPKGVPVRDATLAALPKVELLSRIATAWQHDKWAPVQPMHRAEIKQRGDMPASRTVTLPTLKLQLTLPDDGFAWLVRAPAKDSASDMLDRMAPSLNDVSFEIARAEEMTCQEIFDGIPPDQRTEGAPQNVPIGWLAGPTMLVGPAHEHTVCRNISGGAMMVGLLTTPDSAPGTGNFGPFTALLNAIAAATP